MSPPKSCFLAMLVTIVTFAPPGKLNPYTAEFDVARLNTWLHGPVLSADRSFLYGSHPANKPSRSHWVKALRMEGEMLRAALLPIQSQNAKSLGAGRLLVASRELGDPHFAGTVILLVRYDEKGVLGLVLNRRTDVPLSRALDLKAAKDRSDPIYLGGPVGHPAMFALFQSPAKVEGAENVFGGVYLITDRDLFEHTISARPDPGVFHVYVGYAGWTKEQLRTEVQLGAWFVFPADAGTVFNSNPDSLWQQMIRKTEMQMAKSEPFAADPSLQLEGEVGDVAER